MTGLIGATARILQQPGFPGLLGAAFALGVGHSFVGPFLSLWGTREVGMRPLAFGVFMTLTSLSGIVVATALARWSDTHLPRKVVLVLGGSGAILGYTGYAFIREPAVLLGIGCTVLAVGTVCFSQLFAHTRERFFAAHIPGVPPGILTSVVRVCFSLAWTAGPSVGAIMLAIYGFHGLFLGAASLFVIFVLAILHAVPFEPRSREARSVAHPPVWRVITRGDIFALFLAFLLIFAAHTLNMMNLPLVVTTLLGGTPRDVGIAFGIGPLAEIPLMLWFGLLAARGHQLALIRFGAASTLVYFLLLRFTTEPWHVFPLQILHGLSFAIISNVAIVFFQDLLPGQPGLATTIFTNASHVGNLVGFLSFATLVQPFGHRGVFLVSAAFTAGTLVLMLVYRPRVVAAVRSSPSQ